MYLPVSFRLAYGQYVVAPSCPFWDYYSVPYLVFSHIQSLYH